MDSVLVVPGTKIHFNYNDFKSFKMDLAKIEEEELALTPEEKRFLLDLEFIQSLANPSYLQCTNTLNPQKRPLFMY